MNANYPVNCWYVAATSDEVGRTLFARRLLGIPVVLYRRSTGEIVAMEDRCAHRAYPLSAGRLDGDRLVCGYHGISYNTDGSWADVPSQENVPAGAQVRTFPVHEQAPFVWIWLGEPGAASLRPPPRTAWLASNDWMSAGEVLRVEANYLLLHEHYLDLTNVFVMHPEAVPPGIETLPPLDEVEVSELSVAYTRELPPTPLAEWEAEATGLAREEKYVRREQGTFVSPALHVQKYVIQSDDVPGHELMRIQGFTPETSTATHVFMRIARNFALDRALVTEHLRVMFHEMAVLDSAVVEAVQRRHDEDTWPRRDINVKADRAALRARRVARGMVEDEARRTAAPRDPVRTARHE